MSDDYTYASSLLDELDDTEDESRRGELLSALGALADTTSDEHTRKLLRWENVD